MIGAGTIGRGAAHVLARAGIEVWLRGSQPDSLESARSRIGLLLDRGVARGAVTAGGKEQALSLLHLTSSLEEAVVGAGS